jgi:hypothetical protein
MKPWQTGYNGLLKAFSGLCEATGALIQRAAVLPHSTGYEPFVVEQNLNPVLAGMIARLLVRSGKRLLVRSGKRLLVCSGKRCANENIRRPVFVGVIRFLAKPGRSRQTSRKTKALPAAWEKSSLVGRIIKEANLSASEFSKA